MADLARLTEALRNADAAGDTAAATKFAQAIRALQADTNTPREYAGMSKTGHGLAEKFGKGVSDIVMGAGQLGLHGAASLADMVAGDQNAVRDLSNRFDNSLKFSEDYWQAERGADPGGDTGIEWMRGLGSATALAPAMLAAPSLGAGFLPAVAEGGMQGAISAGLSPTYGNSEDFWADKAGQTGTGAALGGVTSGVLNRAGAMLRPEIDQAVNYLRQRGVQPTVGQNIGAGAATFEDALSSINPAVSVGQKRALEQYNVAALNEALARIPVPNGSAPVKYTGAPGREGVKAVGDLLSDAFNAVKKQVTLPADNVLRTNLTGVVNEASVVAPEIGKRLQTFLDAKVLNRVKNGVLTGEAFKEAESALTTQARRYSKSITGDDRVFAAALHDAADVLRNRLADANPNQAAMLKGLNEGWAILARIEDAVPTGNAEGLFTPFQLARAVETADSSVRHRAYVRGEALLQPLTDAGLKVLGNKYPNSGTAGRVAAGALLGGAAMVSPTSAVALASSALAYTPLIQRLLGSAINGQRSTGSSIAGTAIQAAAPYAGAGAALAGR